MAFRRVFAVLWCFAYPLCTFGSDCAAEDNAAEAIEDDTAFMQILKPITQLARAAEKILKTARVAQKDSNGASHRLNPDLVWTDESGTCATSACCSQEEFAGTGNHTAPTVTNDTVWISEFSGWEGCFEEMGLEILEGPVPVLATGWCARWHRSTKDHAVHVEFTRGPNVGSCMHGSAYRISKESHSTYVTEWGTQSTPYLAVAVDVSTKSGHTLSSSALVHDFPDSIKAEAPDIPGYAHHTVCELKKRNYCDSYQAKTRTFFKDFGVNQEDMDLNTCSSDHFMCYRPSATEAKINALASVANKVMAKLSEWLKVLLGRT